MPETTNPSAAANRETARVGVYVCHCGTNIAGTVDVKALAAYAAGLPGVAVSREYKYMCSDPGQELIQQDIHEHELNRVVVASCSPLLHEPTFRRRSEPRRDQSVLPSDGEYPRARFVGASGQSRGDAEGEGPGSRSGAAGFAAQTVGEDGKSRSIPMCWLWAVGLREFMPR